MSPCPSLLIGGLFIIGVLAMETYLLIGRDMSCGVTSLRDRERFPVMRSFFRGWVVFRRVLGHPWGVLVFPGVKADDGRSNVRSSKGHPMSDVFG